MDRKGEMNSRSTKDSQPFRLSKGVFSKGNWTLGGGVSPLEDEELKKLFG